MKDSFIMFAEYEQYFKMLDEHNRSELLLALFAYENRGEEIILDGMALAYFTVMKNNLDRSREKYVQTCEKRADAGRRGRQVLANRITEARDEQIKAIASKSQQMKAFASDNVPVPVPVLENDPENDIKNISDAPASDKMFSINKVTESLEADEMARLLYTLHCETIDHGFRRSSSQLTTWARDIEKLNRIDGRGWNEIEEVIRWAKTDPFWSKNIIAGDTLRRQFDKLLAGKKSRPRYSPKAAHWDSQGEAPAIKPHLKTNIFDNMPEYDQDAIEF